MQERQEVRRFAGLGLVSGRLRVFRLRSEMHRPDVLPHRSAGAALPQRHLREADPALEVRRWRDRLVQVQKLK